ncbi:SulA-like leucine-rich domain-containing protein [Pseudoalteromonas ardens]|uniref:SulA-like leucine-rich domain-containing protein n=1 Tax=Pseudoalteromonas ardens TaxID=3048490 RepID=UPI0006764AEA|nr:SulA-like leucine-rich domain-containing protein [Pseudoalteromonas sp. R96]MDK1311286.1 SulA-like leucine-rich domain-containing protein [Pseudoalteromonas sp. R96]
MLHTQVQNISVSQANTANKRYQLVYAEDDIVSSLELLKILYRCNSLHRWTLLIAPDNIPGKALLDNSSIDSSKLLVLRQRHLINLEYVINSALCKGNFAAVITWTDIVSEQQLSQFKLVDSDTEIFCFTRTSGQEVSVVAH